MSQRYPRLPVKQKQITESFEKGIDFFDLPTQFSATVFNRTRI